METTWEELFKHLSPEEIDKAENDVEWILNALEHPTYLMSKADKSNMFELSQGDIYYIEYVRKRFAERGYILRQGSRFSKAISVISERELAEKTKLQQGEEPTGNDNGVEPGD